MLKSFTTKLQTEIIVEECSANQAMFISFPNDANLIEKVYVGNESDLGSDLIIKLCTVG